MKTILTLVVLILSGCSVTIPSITDYRIAPDVNISASSQTTSHRSIKILPVFTTSNLMANTMHYRVGEYKEYAFTQSQWSESPNRAIVNQLAVVLENSNRFSGVFGYKSAQKGDLVLEVSVHEFIQYFNENKDSSYVALNISYHLSERKGSKLIASKNFVKKMNTPSLDAQGGVKALNSILAQTFEETLEWLGKHSQ